MILERQHAGAVRDRPVVRGAIESRITRALMARFDPCPSPGHPVGVEVTAPR